MNQQLIADIAQRLRKAETARGSIAPAAVHVGGLAQRGARYRVESAVERAGLAHRHDKQAGAFGLLNLKRLELCRALP